MEQIQTGSVTYSIAFSDLSSNAGTAVTSGTGSVTFDKTVPTLSSVAIASNNSTTTLAKVADVVTVTFTADTPIQTPVVTFQSGSAAIADASITYVNTSGNIWTAAYTTDGADTDGSVTYSIAFSDLSSNAGTAVTSGTGSVTFDKTVPTLSSVAMVSNNTTTTLAKVADVVTLTFTASETIRTPVVTFESGSAAVTDTSITYVNTSGNIWTAAYTTDASDTDGSVTYSIAFNDLSSNAGTAVTGGGVTFDDTVPTLSSVAIASNNSTTTLAKVADVVTLTFTASETISTPVVTFQSGSAAVTDTSVTYVNTSGTTWTAAYTTDGADTDGSVTYSIAFSDLSSNAGTAVTSGTGSVTFDKTAPSISAIATSALSWGAVLNATEDNSVGTVTVTTSGAEDGQLVTITLNSAVYTGEVSSNTAVVTITASGLQNLTHGSTYTLTADVSDAAGNAAAQVTSSAFTVDTLVPEVNSVTATTVNGIYNSGDQITVQIVFSQVVYVTGSATITLDTGGSGDAVSYSTGSGSQYLDFVYTVGSGDTSADLGYLATNSLALVGSATIKDVNGNDATLALPTPGATNSLADSKALVIDTTVPTLSNVSIASDNTTTTLAKVADVVTLTFTASETIGTPVVTFTSGSAAVTDTSITYVNTSGNTWTAAYTADTSDTARNCCLQYCF